MKEEFLYLEENDGKPRWHVLVVCNNCKKEFYKPVRFAARTTNYCSKDCHNIKQRENQIRVSCKTCGNNFYIQLKRYNRSKTKTFYCNRACKNQLHML